ncbi:50S ribosomal protein L29 [Patescibacteria group bacterium]|nr:50S ribosomal protein L29 [Patescibacteria group bacterium]
MKAKDLRKKSEKDLTADLIAQKENLASLRLKLAVNKLKNVKEIKNIKRDIARLLTVIKETWQKED